MVLNRRWIYLSLAAAFLMALSSAGGLFLPGTYARETASWAAQAAGQDIANLFFVFPATLAALHFAYRGSLRGTLVALGLLIYIVYSFVLYAFFVHFNSLFLVYVAVLGLSGFALSGCAIQMNREEVSRILAGNPKGKLVSVILLVFGVLFAAQWLSEIVPPLLSGTSPASTAEIGVPVSPVHVLDLAFLLPGIFATAAGLRRRRPLALLFAAPLLTFSSVMGIAILAMMLTQHARGASIAVAPVAVMAAVVLVSLYGAYAFLRRISA
jgi:hypothetical protein